MSFFLAFQVLRGLVSLAPLDSLTVYSQADFFAIGKLGGGIILAFSCASVISCKPRPGVAGILLALSLGIFGGGAS